MSRTYVDKGGLRPRSGVYRTLATALERGKAVPIGWEKDTPNAYRYSINYAGRCLAPIHIHRDGLPLQKGINPVNIHVAGECKLIMLDLAVPCRTKCTVCLRNRAMDWRQRAMTECRTSERTWFGSLTLSPEQHARVGMACRAYWLKSLNPSDRDFDTFPWERQFRERDACIYREITLYLKRVRENSEAEIRFLCVAEAHTEKLAGLPHYHMLVHEVSPASPVRHKVLSEAWRVGHCNWKLVEGTAGAGYITKYLSKAMLARVRASLRYGSTSLDIAQRENLTHPSPLALARRAVERSDTRAEGGPLGGNHARGSLLPSVQGWGLTEQSENGAG